MKVLRLFALSGCAVFFLSSCDFSVGKKKQLEYNHTTLTDTDGYRFFQSVGGIAAYEVDFAKYVSGASSDAAAQDLASKSQSVYAALLPLLDSLATKFQVDFPIKSAAVFNEEDFEQTTVQEKEVVENDSTIVETIETKTSSFKDSDYAAHVRNNAAEVLDQFERLSRNTHSELREFSKIDLRNQVEDLYQAAGGNTQ